MPSRRFPSLIALSAGLAVSPPLCADDSWDILDSIPLDAVVVDLLKDPHRPLIYAANRVNNEILIVDLELKTLKSLYVGKLPTSIAISEDGSKLYVANAGTGSGTPGGYWISVVDLETLTFDHHFLTTSQPINLVVANDRLFYNSGSWEQDNIHSNGGSTGVVDLTTETQTGTIGGFVIKSRMVTNSERTKLYGQYTYSGNLGEMGVFDIEGSTIFKLDRHSYSPYPYGWDYNNYCISTNGNRLAYGTVLFNANNLLIQYGVFTEQIHALNHDGTVAFGRNSVWNSQTFSTTGDATPLLNHNLASTVMQFDAESDRLYAFTATDFSLKVIGPTPTPSPTDDSDLDGLNDQEEAELGTLANNPDTDGDGLDDGSEVTNGFDPLVSDPETPAMRALLSTLRRNPAQLELGSPILWLEYGQVKLQLDLHAGDDLQGMSPLGESVLFSVPKPAGETRQFYQIRTR